ncbi:uncharacterized protein LOC117094603 [Trachypithecus francoisi]|uniref:uncharacterized protein LOC117094603 n=1 Tax=Trachypithecus francoisi TaxID=54180 RepID=UPI00141B9FCA|nr:uncharacterized protein LOC117094603 [Trachypithecus francoisi]
MGSGWSPASDPRLGAWRSPVRPEPAPLRGVARRRRCAEAGGREVKVRIAGSGRLLEGARRRGPRESRRGRGAGKKDTGHLASAWARGTHAWRCRGGPHVLKNKQKRHPGPVPELPTDWQGAEKRLRRKCHTMGENKGERSETAACARPLLAHSPRPAGAAAAAALPRRLLTLSGRPGLESGG